MKSFLIKLFNLFFQQVKKSNATDNWFESHAYEAVNQICLDLESIDNNFKNSTYDEFSILDYGCGDGIMIASLAKRLKSIGHGVDFNQVNLEELVKTFALNNMNITQENLKFFSLDTFSWKKQYDLVLSWSVIEHVNNLEDYLNNVIQLLKPNGILYLQTWPLWNSSQGHHLFDIGLNPYAHIQFVNEKTLFNHLEDHMLKVSFTDNMNVLAINDYESWKTAAIESYRSCNRISVNEIEYYLKKSKLELKLFKPYFDDVNFAFLPKGSSWSDFAISGGRWILQKI